MRFLFCDCIHKIVKYESIEGVKCFSLSEDFLNGHFDKNPLVPGAIFIEIMAQFLGWLIIYSHDFTCFPIITLVDGVSVKPDVTPGFEAWLQARIMSTSDKDTLGKARIHAGGEVIAEVDRMIYTHFNVTEPQKLEDQFYTTATCLRK